MPIALQCTCGRALKLRDQLAGKLVQCPSCAVSLRVPSPDDEVEVVDEPVPLVKSMAASGSQVGERFTSVTVTCSCGLELWLDEELGGTLTTCPACYGALRVPMRVTEFIGDEVVVAPLVDDEPVITVAPPIQVPKRQKLSSRKKKQTAYSEYFGNADRQSENLSSMTVLGMSFAMLCACFALVLGVTWLTLGICIGSSIMPHVVVSIPLIFYGLIYVLLGLTNDSDNRNNVGEILERYRPGD